MDERPITPTVHGAIDHGFAANLLTPTLLGLTGPAKAICYGFAAAQGPMNAPTDHPLAIEKVVPFRTHGELEAPLLPAILLLPLAIGAFKQRNARLDFGAYSAAAMANSFLTDCNAHDRLSPPVTGRRLVAG